MIIVRKVATFKMNEMIAYFGHQRSFDRDLEKILTIGALMLMKKPKGVSQFMSKGHNLKFASPNGWIHSHTIPTWLGAYNKSKGR